MSTDNLKLAAVKVIKEMLPRTVRRKGKSEFIGGFDVGSMAWEDTTEAIAAKHGLDPHELREHTELMLSHLGMGFGSTLDYEE